MKYSKLIIVSTNELDWRINTLFGTRKLVGYGIAIEYWNLSSLTYKVHVKEDPVDGINLFDVVSKDDFRHMVEMRSEEKPLYIIYMNFSKIVYPFYRILSQYKCSMVYCINGELPQRSNEETKFLFLSYLPPSLIRRLKKVYFYFHNPHQLIKCTPLFYPLKYELHTCLKAKTNYKIDKKTRVIPFNSTDFELSKSISLCEIKEGYYVYIDQFFPLHPDGVALGLQEMNADVFFNSLNRFFNLIENQSGIKTVIAAHPTGFEYYKKTNPFGGRDIYFGKTPELVKNCEAVFCHDSTAISFAVLCKKAIINLSSDEICRLRKANQNTMECMSKELGSLITRNGDSPKTVELSGAS